MAQLKDTIILGDLSVTEDIYANSISLNGKANGANNIGYGLNISNAHIGVNTDNNLLTIHSTADIQIRPGNGSLGTNGYIFNTGALYPTVNGTYDIGAPGYRFKSEYLTGTLILGATGYTGPGSNTVGTYVAPGLLEITNSTPYIDFHNNNSTADFTGRIIADNANGLNISPRLGINTSANASYNLYCNGPSYFNGAAYINNKLTINAGTNAPPLTIQSSAGSYSYIRLHNGSYLWDIATINAAAGSAPANSLQFRPSGGNTSCYITNSGLIYGAVWNDYAEYRQAETLESGRCVKETPTGIMKLTSKRMEKGCEIISDTFGFAIGKTDECQTPIATVGRVLAYTDKPRETFELGMPVCSGPNGTVSQMTEEEARLYPWCIIGTVSEIPTYETWGSGNVKVNNRIWIRVR